MRRRFNIYSRQIRFAVSISLLKNKVFLDKGYNLEDNSTSVHIVTVVMKWHV